MIGTTLRRRLAAGVFGLYALAAGVLVPLHLLHEAAEASAPAAARSGPSFEAPCQDRDCHNPAHHHDVHTHDPATCASCAQARLAPADGAVPAAPAPEPIPAGRAPVAAAPASHDVLPALPRARGPPASS
jgi:hypothetical protein